MIATKYPNRDAIYAAHTIYRDVMRRFIIGFLKEGSFHPEELICNALKRTNDNPIISDEIEATEKIDIDNIPHIIRHLWDSPVYLSKMFNNVKTIWNESELIKNGRPHWAHPSTNDAEPDDTLKLLLLIRDVLDKINAPDEKREVEIIRDRLFSQDMHALLNDKSNQLETLEEEVITLKRELATTEQQLAIAQADRIAVEKQLDDISDIVAAESFQSSDEDRTTDTSAQHLESKPVDMRTDISSKLSVGQWINGTVKNITAFGAFVDLDGHDGLIHKSEMSYNHINDPSDVVSLNDNIEVKVININQENGKISLSLKRDPWEDSDVEAQYPIGSTVMGAVSSTTDYGVFLELEEGLRGMIHKSELSWKQNDILPSDFNPGEKEEVVILNISKEDKRISLGLKQLQPDPWVQLKEKYPIRYKDYWSCCEHNQFWCLY